MRLIDADKLKYYGNHIGDEYEDRFHDFQYVDRDQIDKAPSIDIVRCGECKYWKSTVQMPNGTDVKCLYGRKADDFCSYGNSSEKPNNSMERSSE